MHEIDGDGYLSSGGHRYFADEDLPSRKATRVTHQIANAFQEEIANVVRSTGASLHTSSESYAQMNQLNTAIDYKVAAEASVRAGADSALSAQLAAITSTFYPNFIHGITLGNGTYPKAIMFTKAGKALDSTGAVIMTVPLSAGYWFKNVVQGTGYEKGYDKTGVPDGITLVAGLRLHVFLIRFSDGTCDIGFDTSLTAANLIADPDCACTHYRRISFVYIDSMTSTEANLHTFGHFSNGLYTIRPTVVYEKAAASWGVYWLGSELMVPPDVDITIKYTVLPPSGTVDRQSIVVPAYYASDQFIGPLKTYNAYHARHRLISSVDYYWSSHQLTLNYKAGLGENGMYGFLDSDTVSTIRWLLIGWTDDQGRNDI